MELVNIPPLLDNIVMRIDADEYREKRDEVYQTRLKAPNKGLPSWYARAAKELRDNLAHPDIATDIVRLGFCDGESLMPNYGHLIGAFVQTYGVSVDFAQRIVNFVVTKSGTALQPLVANAGIHYFSNEKKVAGVITSKTSRILYDHIQSEYGKERPSTVYLRIGPGATKEDILDFVNFHWDKYIQPLREAELHKGQQVRNKPKVLRDTMAYKLWRDGKSYKEIQAYIDKHYGDFLLDNELRKIVERVKPKTDVFIKFGEEFDRLFPQAHKANKKLVMIPVKDDAEDLEFKLKIV